jgi:VWFA-related protein
MKMPMRMSSWGECRARRKAGSRGAVPAALAMVVLLVGAFPLRIPAQQATPPAAPAAPADPHQGEAPAASSGNFRIRVEEVSVPVTAINKRGQQVIDLSRDDFQVFEDGVQQTILYFDRETRTPLQIGLILDTSNSARRQLSYEKDAASEFAYEILRGGSTKNRIFLQTYDSSSSIVQDFTHDPDLLNEKIRGLKSGGGKALFDAIYTACREKMLKAGPAEETRRILVLLSDGLDIQSQHTMGQAISMARKAETMIYTIGTAAYGFSNPGDKTLDELSQATGGTAYYPLRESPGTDMETGYLSHGQVGETSQNKGLGAETGRFSAERLVQMADALQAIGRELDEQYTLTYKPTRNTLDGTYRYIKVVSTRRGVNLRWKPGYFAAPEQ